jgi:adenosylcobinamide amidohydrolase
MQVLSWSINQPGFVTTDKILWRAVTNQDLSPELDVVDWAKEELNSKDAQDAVLLLTSRDITCFEQETVTVGDVCVHAVATVGLSNAERVGDRMDYSARDWGTINVAVQINQGLTQAGLLEAMSITVEARTAAVMDANFALTTGPATGTGTDCVAIAAATGTTQYAGLHTDIGEAIGKAVYRVIERGCAQWISDTYLPRKAQGRH